LHYIVVYNQETLWRVTAHKKSYLQPNLKLLGALKCTDAQISDSNRDRRRRNTSYL